MNAQPTVPPLLAANPRLDRWVEFPAPGRVTVSTGRVEIGQGVLTAMLQIAAEELDVAPDRILLRTGDTDLTPNEGYTAGSQSIQFGGVALRLRDPRRFGVVLWKDGDAFRHPLLARLGVEPLGEHFSPEFLYRATRGRGVGIKQLLMNASVVVGIGNIYANESLFKAGIHPRAPSGRLSRARCERLVAAVRDVLLAAIAAGGSSLRDFVHSDGSSGYFQQHYQVYDRAGLACRVCGAAIRVARQGQRSSFFCATCQKK